MTPHNGTRSKPRRIAVVRLSAIGDVVHGMPLLGSLRRVLPAAEVTWIVQPGPAPLLRAHPGVDRVLLFPRKGGTGTAGVFLAGLGREAFDLAIDLQGNLKSALVTAATRAPARLGLHRSHWREPFGVLACNRRGPRATGPHSVDRTLSLCRAIGDPDPKPLYDLSPTAAELELARADLAAVPDPLVAFSVGGREDVREWPDEEYVASARLLAETRIRSLYLSGPEHRERTLTIAGRAGAPARAGTTGLRGLLAHLAVLRERGSVLVACDSAPIHLAVALGLRVVVLSGPQDPDRTGPYGRRSSAVTRWEGLDCAPCLKRTCRHDEEPRACMKRIGPAEVARRARESLLGLETE